MHRLKWFVANYVALAFIVAGCATTSSIENTADSQEDALAILKSMSATLATAKTIAVKTEERHESVNTDGLIDTQVMRRDGIFIRPHTLKFRIFHRDLWREGLYAGGVLGIVDHEEQVFSKIDVPAEFNETVDFLSGKVRVPLPIADFLYDTPYDALVTDGTTGYIAGRDYVRGKPCIHLVFSNADINWEIWLRDDKQMLPARFLIEYKRSLGSPRSVINFLTWDIDPVMTQMIHEFRPPEGYQEVKFSGTTN